MIWVQTGKTGLCQTEKDNIRTQSICYTERAMLGPLESFAFRKCKIKLLADLGIRKQRVCFCLFYTQLLNLFACFSPYMKWKWKSFGSVQAFAFSRESSQPKDRTQVSRIVGGFFNQMSYQESPSVPAEPQGKPKNTGVGSLSLLQWIFLTQKLNQGLLHCRWIL